METDNRWGTGSLQEKVPDTATAAYGARWIDHGESMDIVPDRQGFAWDVEADVERLILAMQVAKLREAATRLPPRRADRGVCPGLRLLDAPLRRLRLRRRLDRLRGGERCHHKHQR